MATSKKSPTLGLVARDLADAHAHIGEALALIAGRVPDDITDKLIEVSGLLWCQCGGEAPAKYIMRNLRDIANRIESVAS